MQRSNQSTKQGDRVTKMHGVRTGGLSLYLVGGLGSGCHKQGRRGAMSGHSLGQEQESRRKEHATQSLGHVSSV